MGPDELHEDTLEPVSDMNNHPVLVAADIEDDPIVGNEVHRVAQAFGLGLGNT